MLADKVSKLDADSLAAVRAGEPIPNAKLQSLALFTTRVFETRGLITKADANAFLAAGYSELQIAAGYSELQIMEVVLAVSVKTLSNYSNHIFHTEVDEVFAPYKLGASDSTADTAVA